jgi:hypothetical protein
LFGDGARLEDGIRAAAERVLQIRHAVGEAGDGCAIERDSDRAARAVIAIELREHTIDPIVCIGRRGQLLRQRRFSQDEKEGQNPSSHWP